LGGLLLGFLFLLKGVATMKVKYSTIIFIEVVLLFNACRPKATPTQSIISAPSMPTPIPVKSPAKITIMAAASLTEAFQELGKQFESQYPNIKVQFNFAGSQQLAQQLVNNAPADVFASASTKYIDIVVQSGRVDKNDPATFANNRLVVIYPKDNPAGLKELIDLAKPGLKLILAAKEVPVGQYSLDFLDKASKNPSFGPSFKDDVLKNVVSYEDNVKSVLTKVVLGEADAGIVYMSDITGDPAIKVVGITIPDNLNVIAVYQITIIRDSQQIAFAKAFVDLVLSSTGQAIFAKYGFIMVTE